MTEGAARSRRSIIKNFSVTLTLSLLVVAGGVLWGGYLSTTATATDELRVKADEQLSELLEILKVPLWNYSDREIKVIGDAYLGHDSVKALTIRDVHGEVLYANDKGDASALFTIEGAVVYRDQTLGVVSFVASGQYLETLKRSFLSSYFTIVVVMVFATLILAGASLSILLKKSFSNFGGLVEDYARGSERAFAQGAAYVEFAPLVDALKDMSARVEEHYAALKASDARLNAFFNESPVGMLIYDAEGRHLKINETLTRVSGISVEAHLGKTLHELLPKEVADEADAVRRQIMKTGQPVVWELSGVLPNASTETQYFLNSFFPIFGPDAKPVAVGGSVVDISELKHTQRALQRLNVELEHRVEERTEELAREKERAENYLKIAATMIVALDARGDVIMINDRGCEVLGYDKKDLVGRNWFETVLGGNERQAVHAIFEQVMSGQLEPVEHFENDVVTRNGERRLISWHNTSITDKDGKIIGSLSAGLDITEQRAIQNSLEEAFELNETIFVHSPVGIAIFDGDGDCIMANQALCDITGATKAQLLAQNFHTIESWKTSGFYDHALKALSNNERVRSEAQIKTTFGRDIVGDCHFAPISVYGQVHLLLMINDMTALKKVQEQLVQSSKMATLGEMATGVAHELNQPLNVIRLAMNNIQNKADRGQADAQYLAAKLEKVVAQVDRASSIIDHMRIFGRKPNSEMALLDPAEVVESAMGLIGEQLRLAGIEVTSDIVDTNSCILGHRVQVEQVLLNLLANARDELDDRKANDKRIALRVGASEDGKEVRFEVEDNGGGIAPESIDRVFEPFYTTKEVGKGTGLGLSISYGIVTEMGGVLEAHNVKDGACFSMTLPAYQPTQAV